MMRIRGYYLAAAAVLSVAALSLPPPAQAQITMSFYDRDEVDYPYTNDDRDQLADGFNMAECQAGAVMRIRYDYSGTTGSTKFDLWTGASCDVKENRDEGKCYEAIDGDYIEYQAEISIEPAWVVDSMSASPECIEDDGLNKVWMFIFDESSDETILQQASVEIGYDTLAPPAPIDVDAEYGEENVTVTWDVENDNPKEWDHFVVLCYASTDAPPQDAAADSDAVTEDVVEEDSVEDVPADADDAVDTVDDTIDDTIDDTTTDASTDNTDGTTCFSGGFEAGGTFDSAYVCSSYLGSTTRSVNIDGLTNSVMYKFAVVAFDDYRNPSPVSGVACATPQEVDDFWDAYKKAGGKADGGFCFIATAACGSPIHPWVKHLKNFRDEILLKTSAGRAFVDFYYRNSPPAAAAIERSAVLKQLTRLALVPAVALAWTSVGLVHHPEILLVFLGAVLVAFGFRRQRRSLLLLAAGAFLAASLASAPASAQDAKVTSETTVKTTTVETETVSAVETKEEKKKNKKEDKYKQLATKQKHEGSPQHFAAELKFGPYYPDVDAEFGGGASPFHDVYGSSSALHGLFEFDYQFLRPPGISLGVGGMIGGFRFEGKALDPATGEASGEETTFAVLPLHLDLVLRVDALLRYTAVPLVPYVKAGLSYYVWWTKNQSGVSEIEGEKGRGGTFGYNLMTGLMICLDPLEPRAARTFDNEVGVNNSYIFAEFFWAQIDNFGTGKGLNLSDMTWLIGLALEF
jgi:hypothetical protein